MLKLSWILPAITRKMTIQYYWSFRQRIRNGQYWTTCHSSVICSTTKTRDVKSKDITNITFFTDSEDESRLISTSPTAHTTWVFLEEDGPSKRPAGWYLLAWIVQSESTSQKPSRRLFANSRNRRFLSWYSSFFINEGPDSCINLSWRFRLKGPKETGTGSFLSYFGNELGPSRGICYRVVFIYSRASENPTPFLWNPSGYGVLNTPLAAKNLVSSDLKYKLHWEEYTKVWNVTNNITTKYSSKLHYSVWKFIPPDGMQKDRDSTYPPPSA